MGEPDRQLRCRAVAAALLLTPTLACGGAAPPLPQTAAAAAGPPAAPSPAMPPQTVTSAPSPPPAGVGDPEAAAVRGAAPVVIEDGGGELPRKKQSLAQAAAAERERRLGAPPPMLSIDDENLAQHATGKLTLSRPEPVSPEASKLTASVVASETYWRQRVRALRERWAEAVEAIFELEQRTAGLRTRFYATDDPYVRDAQVKPAWDHALESLEAARRRARETEQELVATLEEGRLAGALPGWLREGVDLEPVERPYEPPPRRLPPGEPAEGLVIGEPQVVDEG